MLKDLLICGQISGRDADKFTKVKLKEYKSNSLKTPIINGYIGYIECKLWKSITAGECYTFFGNVIHAEVDNDYFRKGKWTEFAQIPFHLGGNKMVYFEDNDE